MAWWKKSEKESPKVGTGSLEEAAAAVTAPDPEPEPAAAAPAAAEPRVPDEPFVIPPDWARGAVKLSFYPLCRWNHRTWCLTDEEAERARPQMQAFLQAVGDRYLPELLSRFITEAGTKFPELLELAVAMAALAWFKYQQVQEAVEREAAASPGPVPVPKARPGAVEKQGEDDIQCEVCGLWFENRAYLVLHLPCPGRTQ